MKPPPPQPELSPYADAIARLVRAGAAEWPWRRARVVARDRGAVGFADDVVFELTDGSQVRPPRSLQLHHALDPLQQRYREHGSRAFIVSCVVTPTRVESFLVDTESDPWPGGWPDPDALPVIAHFLAEPPPWLQARLQQLRPADRKAPTLAALWTTQAQLLLDDLGADWEPRGTGAGLTLLRRHGRWLLDVVLFERSREGTGGRLRVCVVDLLDGCDHLTFERGIEAYVPSLRSPNARRLIAGAALGPGFRVCESTQAASEGAGALLRARLGGEDHHLLARADRLIRAAAWQLALAPATAEPYAVRAADEVRRLIAEDTRGGFTEGLEAKLGHAQHLSSVARSAPAERALAMQERADAKVAALRLDRVHRRSLPRPTLADPMQPTVSWSELLDALERELSVLPRDGVLSLHEWRPGGVTARLSRRRDDGRLELEVPDDRYLPSTRQGGPQRTAALQRAGWLDPDSVAGGWLSWRWPAPGTPRQLAAAALDALRLVYAVERPERLGVQAVWGSSSVWLPMPDIPVEENIPRGLRGGERQRARNGRYVVTEAGDRQLREHDGNEYVVVEDDASVDGLLEMVPGGVLLAPAPADVPCVQISTVATSRSDPTTSWIVLERDGKYLLTQPPGSAEQAWVHDEDVVVHEVRLPE